MAHRDREARLVRVSVVEALALQLAARASGAAGAAVRQLGYPEPTEGQWRRITAAICAECMVAGQALPVLLPQLTDDELDRLADVSGISAVREVLGPPPHVQ